VSVLQVSSQAKDLMKQLLAKESSKRISLAGIAAHPWMRKHVGFSLD
jgi:hypothetical protein